MSDEQMREQFEDGYSHPWGFDFFKRDVDGQYESRHTFAAWEQFQKGYRARDAEVQVLREALEKIVELSRKPLSGGFEFALAFTAAEKIARAALAGGGRGSPDE